MFQTIGGLLDYQSAIDKVTGTPDQYILGRIVSVPLYGGYPVVKSIDLVIA